MVSVPLVGAVTVTVQAAWLTPVDARVHVPPVAPPSPETVTDPEGAEAVPEASVSVTVTVATLPAVAATEAGERETAVDVERLSTTRFNVCVTFWGVAEESAAWTVKVKVPVPVGVPERTPPAESESPAGSV